MPWAAVGIRMISRRASFFDSLLTIAPLGAADNPLGRRHKRPAPFRALGNNSGLWRAPIRILVPKCVNVMERGCCAVPNAHFVVNGAAHLGVWKVRGRNRITGNRSVRSRSLAPSPPPPRIAIAGDVPRGSRKSACVSGDRVSCVAFWSLALLARRRSRRSRSPCFRAVRAMQARRLS